MGMCCRCWKKLHHTAYDGCSFEFSWLLLFHSIRLSSKLARREHRSSAAEFEHHHGCWRCSAVPHHCYFQLSVYLWQATPQASTYPWGMMSSHCYSAPPGVQNIVINPSVCLWVCLSVCPQAYLWNCWTDLHKILCVDFPWPWLGLLWQRCTTLCTSGLCMTSHLAVMDGVALHGRPDLLVVAVSYVRNWGGVWCLWMLVLFVVFFRFYLHICILCRLMQTRC